MLKRRFNKNSFIKFYNISEVNLAWTIVQRVKPNPYKPKQFPQHLVSMAHSLISLQMPSREAMER